jgi:hypothetical protein
MEKFQDAIMRVVRRLSVFDVSIAGFAHPRGKQA